MSTSFLLNFGIFWGSKSETNPCAVLKSFRGLQVEMSTTQCLQPSVGRAHPYPQFLPQQKNLVWRTLLQLGFSPDSLTFGSSLLDWWSLLEGKAFFLIDTHRNKWCSLSARMMIPWGWLRTNQQKTPYTGRSRPERLKRSWTGGSSTPKMDTIIPNKSQPFPTPVFGSSKTTCFLKGPHPPFP